MPTQAAQLQLTLDRVCAVWENINGILLVIGAADAIDDDWVAELNAMQPESLSGKDRGDVAKAMVTFRDRLGKLYAEAEHPLPDTGAINGEPGVAAIYLGSGRVLDSLILYLIAFDPIAQVANYYVPPKAGSRGANEAAALIELATRRLDSIIEDRGL